MTAPTQSDVEAAFSGNSATSGDVKIKDSRLRDLIRNIVGNLSGGVVTEETLPASLAALGVPYLLVRDFTADEIRTQASDPPIIAAAVGANKILQVLSATMEANETSIPFIDGDFNISYADYPDPDFVILADKLRSKFDTGDPSLNITGSATITPYEAISGAVTNKALVWAGGQDDLTGAAATISVDVGGTDWAVNNEFDINGSFPPPHAKVTSVGALGVVTGIQLLTGGAGALESNGNTTTATTGVGVDLTVNIDSITPANGTARLRLVLQQLDRT